jgi:Zn-dependent metalloprotease
MILILCLITTVNLNSQAFDYLKKSKSDLNKDISKKPNELTLKRTANALSNFYRTTNNYNTGNSEVNSKKSNTVVNTKMIKPQDLIQKTHELSLNNIHYAGSNGLPFFITIPKLYNTGKSSEKLLTNQNIYSYINENISKFQIKNPEKELKISDNFKDNEGNSHIRLQQYHDDIPVWGKELIMHFDIHNDLYLVNGRYNKTITGLNNENNIISRNKAIDISLIDLSKTTQSVNFDKQTKNLLKYYGPKSSKFIWVDNINKKPYVVWVVEIRPNIIDNWRYFIDVQTGNILEKYNAAPRDGSVTANAKDGLGKNRTINVYLDKGVYYMIDATKPMYNNNANDPKGIILTMSNNYLDLTQDAKPTTVVSNNNQWSDAFSVSAHYNAGIIYDYYKNTHSRNSLDDKGMNMLAMVHVTDNSQYFDNAFWNGQFVVLGDGGQFTNGWPPALDFTAHEFTHGVVTFTVDLEYKNQSGALNEAFADWGGCMVDREDWLLGEDIVKLQNFPSGAMRDMAIPHNGGTKGDQNWLPAHMNEFMDLSLDQDNGGVHYNCGIINKATFLIGNSIGKDKLEKIYYRVLNNNYLSKQAEFIDMRLACVKASEEIYGKNSNEVNTVKYSFDQVGITDGNTTTPDPDLPAVEGTEWIAFVASADFSLNIAKPVIQNQNTDIKKVTSTKVYAQNNGTITVPENGSMILFIDIANNLKGIKPDGTNETFLNNESKWRSIAISPNGQFLAATSVNEEPIIYIFDLENSTFKIIDLFTPTTGDDFNYIEPLYANTMSWDVNNTTLVYDALNYKFDWNGNEEYYFDMNAIDVSSEVIFRIFPAMSKGISIGSPDFSKTSNHILAFLVYDDNTKFYYVNGVDLFNGTLKNILYSDATQLAVSSPVYSVKDNKLAFQVANATPAYGIMQIALASDKISSVSNPTDYLTNVGLPKWFAIGERPSDIDDNDFKLSKTINIYPNPSRESVDISFELLNSDLVSISIIELNGSELINLVDKKYFNTGLFSTYWNGKDSNGDLLPSGIYYVKIIIGNNVIVKKISFVR